MSSEHQVLREIDQTATLRADDVRNVAFSSTRAFQVGYSVDDVDGFLDEVQAALALDLQALGRLRPSEVANPRFEVSRLRPGYRQEEVDGFLELVRSELARRWEIAGRQLGSAWTDPGERPASPR